MSDINWGGMIGFVFICWGLGSAFYAFSWALNYWGTTKKEYPSEVLTYYVKLRQGSPLVIRACGYSFEGSWLAFKDHEGTTIKLFSSWIIREVTCKEDKAFPPTENVLEEIRAPNEIDF